MDSKPVIVSSETVAARAYLLEHRGKLMVLNRPNRDTPQDRDYFFVDSVGTHPTGLIVTGLFDHNRKECFRPSEMRFATETEIAGRESRMQE